MSSGIVRPGGFVSGAEIRTHLQFAGRCAPRFRVPVPARCSKLKAPHTGDPMPPCTHLNQVQDVTPRTDGCEECLKTGDSWVHLRLCRICGHVGCCDSSKNRHATKHFHATAHPIMHPSNPARTGAGAMWMRSCWSCSNRQHHGRSRIESGRAVRGRPDRLRPQTFPSILRVMHQVFADGRRSITRLVLQPFTVEDLHPAARVVDQAPVSAAYPPPR